MSLYALYFVIVFLGGSIRIWSYRKLPNFGCKRKGEDVSRVERVGVEGKLKVKLDLLIFYLYLQIASILKC